MTVEELWFGLGGSCIALIVGGTILHGAQQKWHWLVDPPGDDSLLKLIFGGRFWLYHTYVAGVGLVFAGLIGLLFFATLLGEKLGYW